MNSSPRTRNCLVCGAPTTSAHYGVDACRACTVFYRKARKKQLYACRATTRRCNVTQDGVNACKRCRFDRFERILKDSGAKDLRDAKSPDPIPHIPDLPVIERSILSNPPQPQQTPRPILDKCAVCYKMFSAMRRNSELNERPNPTHPLKINSGEYDIIASTYGIMNSASRFLLTGILDIAETLYPEFTSFTKDEQWTMAVSYYNRIFMLEGCYHAEKVYPDDMSKALGAYTAYMSVDVVDRFFDDCPNQTANMEEAKILLKNFIDTCLPSSRIALRRANLDEQEFYAVLVLSFWFADCLQMRDEIVRIGDRYRQAVLKELQAHYREDLKLDDYAARIGELFMLVFNFDRTSDVDEHFEMYRLMGIFADDTFVYRLRDRPL